jgi:hypothetical protein
MGIRRAKELDENWERKEILKVDSLIRQCALTYTVQLENCNMYLLDFLLRR